MTELPIGPVPEQPRAAAAPSYGQVAIWGPEPELKRVLSWSLLRRHRWLVAGCVLAAVAAAAATSRYITPQYEASTSLRIEAKQHNLPELFRRSGVMTELETEMEVLRSRTLLDELVPDLGLRVVLTTPSRTPRSEVLQAVSTERDAPAARYLLRRGEGGHYMVLAVTDSVEAPAGEARVGEPASFGGVELTLVPGSELPDEIGLEVRPAEATLLAIAKRVRISQPNRDAEILNVSFRDADPELAWQMPSELVRRFMAQRQANQQIEAKSTVEFLREQIASLSKQLTTAEQNLRRFRETQGVIEPQAEATSQVSRLVTMQTERGLLEAQRGALAELIRQVESGTTGGPRGDRSSYRRLLAFPALLQSQAATGLLQALTRAEDEREALLVRRTPEDSDVQALDRRIDEIEQELRGIAETYLQSVTNQVASLDAGISRFRAQLREVPERELQYARLDREPKVIEGIYTMLQTRLKEAEIAAAARDPTVRIVDVARRPIRPVWPRRKLIIVAAVVCGLFLGIAAALTRERLDKTVRSRADIRSMTGLDVVGLIPHIPHRNGRIALIAERRTVKHVRQAGPPQRGAKRPVRGSYTFLSGGAGGDPADDPAGEPAASRVVSDGPVLAVSGSHGAITAAYGTLETNMAFARDDIRVKLIVFTSALSGEGKTTTTVNYGLALAQRGFRVLLVDGDMRRGALHTALGVEQVPGLVDVLRGEATFASACQAVPVEGGGTLYCLPTGRPSVTDLGLAAAEITHEFLTSLRDRFDAVLVDTPPVSLLSDAAVLGAVSDGVVLVARTGITDATALGYAVEQLRRVRAPVLGVVLNDINLRRDAAYDSVYRYFTKYEYTAPPGS